MTNAQQTSPRSTEVDAYIYIKNNLKTLGWDTRNPLRIGSGQVFTQNEPLSHPELGKLLKLDRPENIIKVTESVLWVVESKREHKQLDQAVNEAIEYAKKINKGSNFKALFVSGVAGNPYDSYLIRTMYLQDGNFEPVTINDKEASSLMSPEIASLVLRGGPKIQDLPLDEQLVLQKAQTINSILHEGAINKNSRARVVAALLLAMIEDTPPNIDAPPAVLIGEINARARHVLDAHGKAGFYPFIEINPPSTEENHFKYKKALVQTIQELNNLNIRSAMNSGTDVLGQFYEVFLKYGNGAKEIGIVLTPRHITKFAVEAVSVNKSDIIYDPTCGTGGFLVAGFDKVKQNSTPEETNVFKQHNIFGTEQEDEVVALAIVNMIFRGDGKNNIAPGNCFANNLHKATFNGVNTARFEHELANEYEKPVTKVLMNPPFALKSSDDKEYKFVNHALNQMKDGGVLFSVLPYSSMVRPGGYQQWRREMLQNNTLLSVITFPDDLFYPIGVHTVGMFVKKGIPHPANQNVLWIRALHDGLLKSKGKRLPSLRTTNDYPDILPLIKSFIASQSTTVNNIDRFQKACPVDFDDPLFELVPENYLDQAAPSNEELSAEVEKIVRESVAFIVQNNTEYR